MLSRIVGGERTGEGKQREETKGSWGKTAKGAESLWFLREGWRDRAKEGKGREAGGKNISLDQFE